MHYTGQVYRHPIEADTPLLEVTIGCSHNKCSFCTMYRETPFGLAPKDHVDEDLEELKSYGVPIKRIFLVNGEAFVLSTSRLIEIGEKINSYFPEIEAITSYASIANIRNKSLEDLKKLRALNFNQLHIGLESGYDPALKLMNKDFNRADAEENLAKLIEAGFEWDAIVMVGITGEGKDEHGEDEGFRHVRETAELINKYPPYLVSLMTTSVSTGSELEEMRDRGEFLEETERKKLEEEKMLLNLLNVPEAYFFGSHNYNLIPVSGKLKYKEAIVEYLDNKMKEMDDALLDSVVRRANI